MRSVGVCSAWLITSPRRIASFATSGQTRLSAQRSPARAVSLTRFCARRDRTRAVSPEGLIWTRSPTLTDPATTVPVTTTPTRASVNTRSTARRNQFLGPVARLAGGGLEMDAERLDASPGHRRNREDLGVGERRTGDQGAR